jgi:hypothetical protein
MIIHWGIEGDMFRVYNNGELFQEFGEDLNELWALAFLLLEDQIDIVREDGDYVEISEDWDRAVMARDLLNLYVQRTAKN